MTLAILLGVVMLAITAIAIKAFLSARVPLDASTAQQIELLVKTQLGAR